MCSVVEGIPATFVPIKNMPKELASRLDSRAMLMLRPDVQSWATFEKAFQEADRITHFVGSKDVWRIQPSCNLNSSTIGKTIHGVFRDRVVPFVRAGATELQFSAHRGALVSIAAHIVRMHQNWLKAIHRCDYTIFVDIASAYYSLLRQLAPA